MVAEYNLGSPLAAATQVHHAHGRGGAVRRLSRVGSSRSAARGARHREAGYWWVSGARVRCLAHGRHVFPDCPVGPRGVLKARGANCEPPGPRVHSACLLSPLTPLPLSLSPFAPQSISTMKLMQFQGMKHKASSPISLPPVQHLDLTPSPEVPLMIMKRKLMYTNDLQESRRLVEEIHKHLEVSGRPGLASSVSAS